MKIETTSSKPPITHEKIFKIMQIVMYVASGAFFLKNLIDMNIPGMLAIGVSIIATLAMLQTMKAKKADLLKVEFYLSICLIILIFAISLFSGDWYSDDFPLLLAAIGMTGMYLEPKFTKIQIVVADIALVAMYIIHPEKSVSLGQYILCFVIFNLAAWLILLAITRGRAFIDMTIKQTAAAEGLIDTMKRMGDDIQNDFDKSSRSIEESTQGLEDGSTMIINETETVSESCNDVQEKIHSAESHIDELNDEVKKFEIALSENQMNIESMKEQLKEVTEIVERTNSVFAEMKHKINAVAGIAEQLSSIALKTTLLSLNASVEASHAGEAGAGFSVVATEMKSLSESSDKFADQVADAVRDLLVEVDNTAKEFKGTTDAIERTEDTMNNLNDGFEKLTKRFEKLYENIEAQNSNIHEVDDIFGTLKNKVSDMRIHSEENHRSVQEIAKAMDNYRENVDRIVSNTKMENIS